MKILVVALLCLFLVASCAEIKDENKKTKSDPETISALSLGDYLTIKVEPSEKPEKYLVYFSWPRLEEGHKVRIKLSEVLSVVGPNQTTFSHEVDHNQNLTYVFDILSDANKVQKSISKLVNVPMDLVFNETKKNLTADIILSARRVFLMKDVVVTTNGFRLDVNTEELISDEGTIQTFPPDSKAELGLSGISPQEISIKAQIAVGKLNITMRGQAGGDGADGEKFLLAAMAGTPATNGESRCTCNLQCIKGFGTETCNCTSYGADGGRGVDGLPGRKGGDGNPGGNSGKLTISVKNGTEFEVQTLKEVGKAGAPGKGGDGQPGGAGGPKVAKASCSGSAGPSGNDGERGADGVRLEDGHEDPICIYIASEEKNDCL